MARPADWLLPMHRPAITAAYQKSPLLAEMTAQIKRVKMQSMLIARVR